MDRLEQIKNEVAREYDFDSWDDCFDTMATAEFSHPGMFDYDKIINEVARRYATEMVRHNLERAANEAAIKHEILAGCLVYTADKQSILKLEIELI